MQSYLAEVEEELEHLHLRQVPAPADRAQNTQESHVISTMHATKGFTLTLRRKHLEMCTGEECSARTVPLVTF